MKLLAIFCHGCSQWFSVKCSKMMLTNFEKLAILNYNLWYMNTTSPLSYMVYEMKYFSDILIKSFDSWDRGTNQTKLRFFFFFIYQKKYCRVFTRIKSCQTGPIIIEMQLICAYIYYYFFLLLNSREKDSWKRYILNPKWRGSKEIRDIQTCKGES